MVGKSERDWFMDVIDACSVLSSAKFCEGFTFASGGRLTQAACRALCLR